jgi:hypothetical protein
LIEEESFKSLLDDIKQYSIHIMEIPGEEGENGTEKVSEKLRSWP